jgi:hypothetical protein
MNGMEKDGRKISSDGISSISTTLIQECFLDSHPLENYRKIAIVVAF